MVFFPIGWEGMIYPTAIADYELSTVLLLDIHNAKEQNSARPKNDATTLGNDFTTGRKQTAGFALQTVEANGCTAGCQNRVSSTIRLWKATAHIYHFRLEIRVTSESAKLFECL